MTKDDSEKDGLEIPAQPRYCAVLITTKSFQAVSGNFQWNSASPVVSLVVYFQFVYVVKFIVFLCNL